MNCNSEHISCSPPIFVLYDIALIFSHSHAPAWECIPYGFPRWSMGTRQEPNYPLNEKKDRLEELIEFLRERESKDLDLFIDILPKLINWKLSK